MATLSNFPSFLSLSSRNLSFLDQLQTQNQQLKLRCFSHQQLHHRRRECSVCARSIRKSRAGRKTKSNEELCSDIRDFVKSVGLSEDHIPSTKELLLHGRIELANIVRRRGHKLIRELLTTNSTKIVESVSENITLTGQDGEVVEELFSPNKVLVLENLSSSSNINDDFSSDDCTSSPTTTANSSAEEELSNDLECHNDYSQSHREDVEKVEDMSLKTEATASEDYFSSSNVGSDVKCNDYTGEPTEFSTNLSVEKPEYSLECPEYSLECRSEIIDNIVDESSLSPEVIFGENYMINATVDECLDMHHLDGKPLLLTDGSSSKEEALYCSNEQIEKVDNNVDGVSLLAEIAIIDDQSSDLNIDRALEHEESSYKLIKYSEELSLAEKVAKFIQNGDLDMIDDNFDAILSESGAGKINGSITTIDAEETKLNSHVEACSEEMASGGPVMASNGSALESEHIMSSTTVDQLIRDDQPSTEALSGQDHKELGGKRKGNENRVAIDRLKFMLHQKELELSQLKEQIESDKVHLSALQSKAETEISNAQKLILEKDSELLAAEESLSGLEEVHIQYRGDGEIVEVAGSFNGWHHRIKMDPNVVDSINSKKPRLWSTLLWLYPGVYEIKFVVDGHWKIDPHRESVTMGAISNNILRVGR